MKILLSAFLALALLGACSQGEQTTGETNHSESKEAEVATISFDEFKAGLADGTLVAVDANSKSTFEKNHVKGAVYFDKSKPLTEILPSKKDTQLVFYCANEQCQASHMAAKLARQDGYQNVKVYSGGIEGWIEKGGDISSL
ncbi:MAG: rhodanese-like domain-containing protein [Deltaproteobacteria bacterium]|nr:rhodanese-like domain-containing protein [Deltaproteobacteria bacterium]